MSLPAEAIHAIEAPCEMRFRGVATGYVILFGCDSCGMEEAFLARDLDDTLGPSVGAPLSFRGYTVEDARRLLERVV